MKGYGKIGESGQICLPRLNKGAHCPGLSETDPAQGSGLTLTLSWRHETSSRLKKCCTSKLGLAHKGIQMAVLSLSAQPHPTNSPCLVAAVWELAGTPNMDFSRGSGTNRALLVQGFALGGLRAHEGDTRGQAPCGAGPEG